MVDSASDDGLRSHLQRVLFNREQLDVRVRDLGQVLARDYAGKNPLMVGVLTGCFPFLADLVREMDIPLEVEFMAVSSYGASTRSSGVVKIIKDLDRSVEGRHVVLVEDIVDSGLTLAHLREVFATRHPASVAICTLLDKAAARTEPIALDYVGFECPDAFVVGYGLDYAGQYRNLPCVGELAAARIENESA